jgi:OOP family OmpA-OmpF porin
MSPRLLSFVLIVLVTGCVSTGKAITYANVMSRCPSNQVKEVRQDRHDAVLDVCGVYEDWHWDGLNGWLYVGPSAEQPNQVQADADSDGIADSVDACPLVAGIASPDPAKHGCPADADADGILDGVDACPQIPGVAHADPAKHGCPPPGDSDGDGITDNVDACPKVRGVPNADPAKNGCPPPADTDGDGILDPVDACPTEAGKANPDPKKNGCPVVQVKGDQIVINQSIEFDTGKSKIKAVSNQLLDDIAKVMKDHPEITKVEIQGHTDNQGAAALNRNLSRARAKAVRAALQTRGIAPKRMTSKGFGPDKPVATNDTPEGRQTNRRVQFQITGRSAPTPPPAPAPAPAPAKAP